MIWLEATPFTRTADPDKNIAAVRWTTRKSSVVHHESFFRITGPSIAVLAFGQK